MVTTVVDRGHSGQESSTHLLRFVLFVLHSRNPGLRSDLVFPSFDPTDTSLSTPPPGCGEVEGVLKAVSSEISH